MNIPLRTMLDNNIEDWLTDQGTEHDVISAEQAWTLADKLDVAVREWLRERLGKEIHEGGLP